MVARLLLAVVFCCFVAAMPSAAALAESTDGGEPMLRIPGLPPIPIRPHGESESGRTDTPRGVTPNELRGGVDLSEPPVPASPERRTGPTSPGPAPPPVPPEQRLADLYSRLATTDDTDAAQGIVAALERQWLYTASDTASLVMSRALVALQRNENEQARELLDRLVKLEPQWAEAWNKRATLRFMTDDYEGSMEDIGHVLALDPRHFGALMGMGTILQRGGNDKRALEIYRRVREIYPALDSVKHLIDTLAPDVDGRDI